MPELPMSRGPDGARSRSGPPLMPGSLDGGPQGPDGRPPSGPRRSPSDSPRTSEVPSATAASSRARCEMRLVPGDGHRPHQGPAPGYRQSVVRVAITEGAHHSRVRAVER